LAVIKDKSGRETSLPQRDANRIVEVNHRDIDMAQLSQIRKSRQLEQSAKIDKSANVEVSM
jgi:hypothetical protein